MALKWKMICYLITISKLTTPSIAKSTHILSANFSHPERILTCHQFCQHKVVAGILDITKMDQLAFHSKRPKYIEFISLLYKAHFCPERKDFCEKKRKKGRKENRKEGKKEERREEERGGKEKKEGVISLRSNQRLKNN